MMSLNMHLHREPQNVTVNHSNLPMSPSLSPSLPLSLSLSPSLPTSPFPRSYALSQLFNLNYGFVWLLLLLPF